MLFQNFYEGKYELTKTRMLLVKKVLKEKVPIIEAAKILGLKLTTARFIIKEYRKNGTFPRRKLKRTKRRVNSDITRMISIPDVIENIEDKEKENYSINESSFTSFSPYFLPFWHGYSRNVYSVPAYYQCWAWP